MTKVYDDDFADLEAILVEAETRRQAKGGIHAKREALSHKGLTADARQRLEAEVHTYEMMFVWKVEANVALFHSQICTSCRSTHRFFMGWFTQHNHRTDPNTRRWVAGKSAEALEERIETHNQGTVEMCSDCAECCVILDKAMRSAEVIARAHEEAIALDLQRTERERREQANISTRVE